MSACSNKKNTALTRFYHSVNTRYNIHYNADIAYKEARETVYWIKLLNATHYLTPTMAQSLLVDCEELCKIIGKIQVSTKSRNS